MADPPVPDDLLPFAEVLREFAPQRGWWEQQFARGVIVRYRVPGIRGIWLSRADVERLTAPRALNIRAPRKDELPKAEEPTDEQ